MTYAGVLLYNMYCFHVGGKKCWLSLCGIYTTLINICSLNVSFLVFYVITTRATKYLGVSKQYAILFLSTVKAECVYICYDV